MSSILKQIEANLEAIILANGFKKVSELTGKLGAKFLYKAEDGLYFQTQCDYYERWLQFFIGHRYILKNRPDEYFISGRYSCVVKACIDNFEEMPDVIDFSDWKEYSKKLIPYLASSLPMVLERLTPAILEDFDKQSLEIRLPQFHFCRAD